VLSVIPEKPISNIAARIAINSLIYDWFFPLNSKIILLNINLSNI